MTRITRLETYTWTQLRSLIAMLWLGMTLLCGVIYALVIAKDRGIELESSLKVAGYTVGASLQAQDWDLALGHLRVAAETSGLYELELLTLGGARVAGPLGVRPVGIGTLCRDTTDQELQIRGCKRVLGRNECIALMLLLLSSLGFFLIAVRTLRLRIQSLMGGVARELEKVRAKSGLGVKDRSTSWEGPEIAEIAWIRKEVETLLLEVEESAKDAAFGRVAASVSHDIRGSINNLDFLVATLPEIPDQKRAAIQSTLKRLREIVDDLKARSKKPGDRVEIETVPQPVVPILRRGVADKVAEYRSKGSVRIQFDEELCEGHLFAAVSEIGLFRVISNLIDNAVESISDAGVVRVGIQAANQHLVISVADDGRGIPPEIVNKLGARGVTYGKDGGSGLGLYFSKERVEAWGGYLAIESALGKGTRVNITLPRAARPGAVASIEVPAGGPVVILDDDPTVHAMWRMRFRSDGLDVPIQTFQSEGEFRKWYSSRGKLQQALFLFDYELSPSGKSGLDLIDELGIGEDSILVTGRGDDDAVASRCASLGVRLLSKTMVPDAPLCLKAGEPNN